MRWLEFPPDMKGKQHETQKLHHEGTGGWFLDGPEFKEWKDNPGFLWIKGQCEHIDYPAAQWTKRIFCSRYWEDCPEVMFATFSHTLTLTMIKCYSD